jgi:DNA/RNA-binding domain of Phe-tRNA-synthetase-like protein
VNKIAVSISADVLASFPSVRVAAVYAKISNSMLLRPIIDRLRIEASGLAEELSVVEPISSLPEIASWRETYAAMGVKPSKFHSSIESLLRRLRGGKYAETGLDIVDFYNLVSILQKSPIGAYDARKLAVPEIHLRKANPSIDQFDPLGGDATSFPLSEELVVYASGNSVLCWGFNTRDSCAVCVDNNTEEAIFFSEVADDLFSPRPLKTIKALSNALNAVGIATGEVLFIDKDCPSEMLQIGH